MSQLSISLPDDLRAAAERAVASGRFASVDEYISALIRQDQAVELELVRRVQAGPATPMGAGDFDAIRRRLGAEVARRKAGGQ
jgi:Arc/MetJ-type ribon-helix-helix transcriptional regulator